MECNVNKVVNLLKASEAKGKELEVELEGYKASSSTIEEKMNSLVTSYNVVEKQKTELNNRYVSLKASSLDLTEKNNALTQELEELKRKLDDREARLAEANSKAKEATSKVEEANTKMVEATKEDYENALGEVEKMRDEHMSELRALFEKNVFVMYNATEEYENVLVIVEEKAFKNTETALRRCFHLAFRP